MLKIKFLATGEGLAMKKDLSQCLPKESVKKLVLHHFIMCLQRTGEM